MAVKNVQADALPTPLCRSAIMARVFRGTSEMEGAPETEGETQTSPALNVFTTPQCSPNDLFFRSHWNDIDDIDSGLIDIRCCIAELIGNQMLDNLE